MKVSAGRFWSKIEKTASCWLWRGYTRPDGYGQLLFEGKSQLAHRVAYQLKKGKIPEGLRLAQRCGVKTCVNPAHLVLAFWLRVDRSGDCHLWTGKRRRGQGRAKFRGRQINPRRLAYMLSIGRIPDGEAVSNTCRNPLCCRREHLKIGKNLRRARPDPEMGLFWSKVEKTEGCWLWYGSTLSNGYGRFLFEGRVQLARRVAYQLACGEIPNGRCVRQRCQARACVHPEHLICKSAVKDSEGK